MAKREKGKGAIWAAVRRDSGASANFNFDATVGSAGTFHAPRFVDMSLEAIVPAYGVVRDDELVTRPTVLRIEAIDNKKRRLGLYLDEHRNGAGNA